MPASTRHRFPPKPSRTRTGERYGPTHQRARAAAARQHQPTHPCSRCHQPLGPMGPHLHYDHNETGGYLGFSHAHCNTSAGATKGNHQRHQHKPPRRQSRTW